MRIKILFATVLTLASFTAGYAQTLDKAQAVGAALQGGGFKRGHISHREINQEKSFSVISAASVAEKKMDWCEQVF